MEYNKLNETDKNRIKLIYPDEKQRNDILGALDIYTFGLTKEQTRSFARSKFKTTQMDQLEEVEDIKENDLDLLMKHLNRLVLEPRHLDIYNIARKIVITNQQERYAKLAPHRAEARISLLIQSKTKIGFEVSGGVENSLPIYCREVSFQTVRRSQYNPQGYRLQPGDQILSINKHDLRQVTKNQAENLINKEIHKVSATGQVRLDIVVKRTGFYPTIDHEEKLIWKKVPDYHYFREYLTVYVNITDNQTVGCGLIYIMEKFFVVEVKSGSIAERLGIENGDEIIMINDSTATHTTDHDFGALFKQKKMTLSYVKSNIDQLTKLLHKLSSSKQKHHYIKTIEALKKRINPDSTPSISKSFIDKSMSSNTDKSEEEDVFDDDGEVIPKSPNKKPPGRTSFINRNTRTSFILPSGGNSSDEEPRQTGRKTIGGERSIDDDLEDLFVRQVRKSIIQNNVEQKPRNTKAGFLNRKSAEDLKNGMKQAQTDSTHPLNRKTRVSIIAKAESYGQVDPERRKRLDSESENRKERKTISIPVEEVQWKAFDPEMVSKLARQTSSEELEIYNPEDEQFHSTPDRTHQHIDSDPNSSGILVDQIQQNNRNSGVKPKTMSVHELRWRTALHANGGKGTITVPTNLKRHFNITGKDFKIEPSDSFEVQLYADENDIPCFKSVSWKKLQGGVPFQQNSILPGDQLLSMIHRGKKYDVRNKTISFSMGQINDWMKTKDGNLILEIRHTQRTIGDAMKAANIYFHEQQIKPTQQITTC